MYFQIQDIKDDCLMIAYDNEKYYDLDNIEQRKRLINDVEEYGIEVSIEAILSNFDDTIINNQMKKLLKQFIIERRNRIIEIYNLESED